jgi:hypothetical protein
MKEKQGIPGEVFRPWRALRFAWHAMRRARHTLYRSYETHLPSSLFLFFSFSSFFS